MPILEKIAIDTLLVSHGQNEGRTRSSSDNLVSKDSIPATSTNISRGFRAAKSLPENFEHMPFFIPTMIREIPYLKNHHI